MYLCFGVLFIFVCVGNEFLVGGSLAPAREVEGNIPHARLVQMSGPLATVVSGMN